MPKIDTQNGCHDRAVDTQGGSLLRMRRTWCHASAIMAEKDVVSDPLPPSTSFAAWVQEHGGDEQFVSLLAVHGFSSKLSLGNLDVVLWKQRDCWSS